MATTMGTMRMMIMMMVMLMGVMTLFLWGSKEPCWHKS